MTVREFFAGFLDENVILFWLFAGWFVLLCGFGAGIARKVLEDRWRPRRADAASPNKTSESPNPSRASIQAQEGVEELEQHFTQAQASALRAYLECFQQKLTDILRDDYRRGRIFTDSTPRAAPTSRDRKSP